jgi:hypothetical protein
MYIILIYTSSKILQFSMHLIYTDCMPAEKPPRLKSDALLVRMSPTEKEAFRQSAAIAGIPLGSWIRERLRLAAIHDLENAGRKVPFIEEINFGESNG